MGSNTLTPKNSFWPMIQKLLAPRSNRAPSFLFIVDGTRLLSLTGCRIRSMARSWQTSSNNAPVMSLSLLRGRVTKPAFCKPLHVVYRIFCHRDTVLVNLVQVTDILVALHPGIVACLDCNLILHLEWCLTSYYNLVVEECHLLLFDLWTCFL